MEGRKSDARKKRRRRTRLRRAAQKIRTDARARPRAGELVVGTYNVRTLAFKGTNGIGHAEVILQTCEDADCAIIRLQEVRRDGKVLLRRRGMSYFAREQTEESTRRRGITGQA